MMALDNELLAATPHAPGVYLMLNAKSAVIYVGKAKDLCKRLSTYVHFSGPTQSKTSVMISQVSRVDTLVTRTEKEALILEASLIKKHRPKYNVILRDDKTYPYIKVTLQDDWPRVFMTRKKKRDGARYFGPYSSSSAMWATLKQISSLFPLRRCKGGELKPRKRPCLNHQMGHCLAPCVGTADKNQYREMVAQVIMFLEGRNNKLLSDLEEQMKQAAATLAFEQAARIRDRIASLKKTLEKQVIISKTMTNRDVFGVSRRGASIAAIILFVRKGVINGSRSFFLEEPYGNDRAILSQIVQQVYDHNNPPPPELLLPYPLNDQKVLAEHFADLAGRKVTLSVPQRGEPRALLAMAASNAEKTGEAYDKKKASWQALRNALIKKLRIDHPPDHIECLDISNISGTNSVGSLVCFSCGEPDKKRYRHYKIRSVVGPDDYGSMREVLERRLAQGLKEQNLPDIFMVDGGKGQLNSAISVAKRLGITTETSFIGIAKERKDEGEKVYKPGRKNPILLSPHDPVLLYLMRIRDESHRFGITFHRSLRRKRSLQSQLDTIPGVGPERRKKLLAEIGSYKKISQATVEELQKVPSIGRELATVIRNYFDGK